MIQLASRRSGGRLKTYTSSRDAILDFDAYTKTTPYIWLRAEDVVGVTAGNPITTWLDRSGNGRNATSSGANRPAYQPTALNGLPAVRFAGSHYMTLSSIPKHANYTILCVWQTAAVSTRQWVYGSLDIGGNAYTAWGSMDFEATNQARYYFSNGTVHSTGTTGTSLMTASVPAVTSHRYTSGQTQEEWWKNGIGLTITTSATSSTANSGTAFEYAIGRPGAMGAVYFQGDMSEFVMFNSALTDAQRSQWEVYFQTKYSI